MGGASDKKESYLRFSLDLPTVKFELHSESPEAALPEVRRIIEALNTEPAECIDDDLYELKLHLSDEFLRHSALTTRVRNALVLDEDVRVLKQILPVEDEYDLDTGTQTRHVLNAKSVVDELFGQLDVRVRDCLVHIRGELTPEQQRIIMDAVRQRLGVNVKPRFFSTKRNVEGHALLEAVCFGDKMAAEQ